MKETLDPAMTEQLARKVKAELRKRMRGVRAAASRAAIAERSARIVERLEAEPRVAAARGVALFWPIEGRNEVDLRPMDASLRARAVRVAYPAIDPETRVMTFRWARPEELAERGLGFAEPAPDAPEVAPADLDVVVVPALAIDPRGHRIGYGAGFYDRALPRFCPPASAIAVAFDWQLVVEVPRTEGDVATNAVVTDARTLLAEG